MGEDNGPWLLPIAKASGTEYLVDIEQREFRGYNNPANVVRMHSEKGRQILKECLGQRWHGFGLDKTMRQNSHDMVQCQQCGNSVPAAV